MEKTEKQKMLSGELYFASDPELIEERFLARDLVKKFNDSAPRDLVGRKQSFRTCSVAVEKR